jgi:alkaline phosphatase
MKTKSFFNLFLSLSFLLSMLAACNTNTHDHAHEQRPEPKNIILLIGDGMGYAQLQAAIMHATDSLNMQKMPYTGFQKTASLNDEITDSGAAGTALASGSKTNNGMIGMLPDKAPLINLTERMAEAGKKTAVLASCAITHATPASFLAHNESRNNYEELAEDIALNAPVDLFMGGGLNNFNKRKDGKNHIQTLVDRGFAIDSLFDASEWECHPKQAIFLADFHQKTVLEGRGNQLAKMVKHAVNCLEDSENGFFMMAEGAQIDWAGHANDSAYLMAELYDFDQAVGIALNFARENGETLVIVTSDHETGGFTLVRPKIKDGKSYFHFASDEHTAVMVPVMAYGPGAENFVGLYENTEIPRRIVALLQ